MASYWQSEASWRDRWSDQPVPIAADFAVVGAGISGLSTALRLREHNPAATIAVLEAERVGFGASGRNAGLLSPVSAPVWLLDADRRTDWRWASAHLGQIVAALPAWIAKRAPGAEISQTRLRIAATGAVRVAGLRQFSRMLEAATLDHQVIEAAPQPFIAMPAHVVHPYRLVIGLAEHAADVGISLHERARVARIESTDRGARLLLDGGRALEARRVIVCTNAYTDGLDLGRRLPALPAHSFMLSSQPLATDALERCRENGDFTVDVDRAESYRRVHRNRLLIGGCDQYRAPRGGDFAVPTRVRKVLARLLARQASDAGPVTVTHAWSGKLHATLTGLPIIERSTRYPAVIINVGYGGTGVALALACAPAVAALASELQRGTDDDELVATIRSTSVPVGGAARAAAGLLTSLATPWKI